jgi:hypothetical protein
MRYAVFGIVIAMAGCAQQPPCHGPLGDIRAKIDAQERVIARGSRVVPAQDGKTRLTLCWPGVFCTTPLQQPRGRRVEPIDVAAEQAALDRLRAREERLLAQGATCAGAPLDMGAGG